MRVFHYPWRAELADGGKCALPEPEEGKAAPLLGCFAAGAGGKSVEMPGPTIRRGAGQTRSRAGGCELAFDQRFARQFQSEAPDSPLMKLHFTMTDAFIHLANRLYLDEREKAGKPLNDWPLREACADFREYLEGEQDFAPESLAAEIARSCTAPVEGIMAAPRLMLRRRHAEVPLDRLQELDERSLKDLASRPGRRIADKAGHRQRLAGIVREETPDTYENRVVRDFRVRTARAAGQYCTAMCGRCPRRRAGECATADPRREGAECASARVRSVADWRARCAQWLMTGTAAGTARLAQPVARANYVLEQNPRYARVWKAYLRLLRQENVEEDVWTWMRRTWTDYVRLALMAAWETHLQPRSLVRFSERPLKMFPQNDRGRWLARDPFEEALALDMGGGKVRTIYLLDAPEAEELAGRGLGGALNADVYCVRADEDGGMEVEPIWGVVGCGAWGDGGIARPLGKELERVRTAAAACLRKGVRLLGGVVAAPDMEGGCRMEGGALWRMNAASPDLEVAAAIITGERR